MEDMTETVEHDGVGWRLVVTTRNPVGVDGHKPVYGFNEQFNG